MYFSTGTEAALLVQPRNLVIVGENAGTNHRASPKFERESSTTNSVTEIFAEKSAMVDFIKFKMTTLLLT
jgi:Fe-S cluster assembly protein SufD